MTEITLRGTKGAPLTHQELDENFANLKETADLAYDAVAGVGGKANASALGTDADATSLGTFTGSTIPDGSTAKAAIQALETALEATSGNAATKVNATAVGIPATDADMGTTPGTILSDNGTAKQWFQESEAAIEERAKAADLANTSDAAKGGSLVSYRAAPLKVGNPGAFGYPDDDKARIYLERGLADGIQHTFRVISSGIGDNTNYRGVTNAYFEFRDRDDVTASTKGVGYALHLSVAIREGRNNVPVDDVACLTMGNTSGITSAKGTDCMYISENPLFTVAGTSEWYSIFTADCKADVGYQMRFQPTTKKAMRLPNDAYIYFNTATDVGLGSDRIGIGLATDGALVLGDFSSPRADVRPPLNAVQGVTVAGKLDIIAGHLRRKAPVVVGTGTYTVLDADSYLIINAPCTVTLPAAGSFPGRELIMKTTGNTATSASSNVAPLAGGSAGTAILPSVGGKWCKLVSDGSVWHQMEGNL